MPEPDQAAGTPAASSSIAQRAVSGALWGTAAGLLARALSLVGTVLLVRFLDPADYGTIQSAAVVVLTASQLATLGVGPYIITFPRAGRVVAFHASVIHVGLGAVALGLVWALAGRLGAVFDAPAFGRFIPGLALAIFVDRISFMAERPVVRDLGFRTVSISRTVGDVVFTLVAVALAWRGIGAMALVHGNIARSLVRLLLMLALSNWREWALPAPLQPKILTTLLSYGTMVTVGSIAEFGSRRWDNLLMARFFGPAITGNYVLAYSLADLPSIQIGEQIADVLLASYGHVAPDKRAAGVLRAAGLMALIMAPLSIGLGAVGPTVARAFFRPEWIWLAPMLTWLPIALLMRPLGAVYGGFLLSVRGPRTPMIAEVTTVVLMVVAMATVGRSDPRWAIAAIGLAFCVRTALLMWFAQKTDGISIVAGLGAMLPIIAACVPLVAAVLALRSGLSATGIPAAHPVLELLIEIGAGAVAYVVAAWLITRSTCRDLVQLLRGALQR